MNRQPCRIHMILEGKQCALCGMEIDPHAHSYGEWPAGAWLLPDEWKKPREGSR